MLKRPSTLSWLNEKISLVSVYIPWTYHWLVKRELNHQKTILDAGCGNGSFMYILNHAKRHEVTGVDIFGPSVQKAEKTGVYKKVVEQDILKISFQEKSFDLVISNHVIEHFTKQNGYRMLKKIEKIAKNKVVIVTPMGKFQQHTYGGNKYQEHLSAWYPEDFIKCGYRVIGQGLNIYNRNKLLKKFLELIGPFNNLLFIFHVALQPFLVTRYKYCHQMICVKEMNRH